MRYLRICFFVIAIICHQTSGIAQGHLLVVGGGSEKPNGWSDAPYGWAVEKSQNKRVAVITYDSNPTFWLPNYFISLGASEAKNFVISSTATANLQETYDSLVTYNVIFFKGGNQWNYYNRYKNTLTHDAVEWVYEQGGVIGGTSAGLAILSKVVYTAKNGTVYPYEALEDPFNDYMTLANDFLDIFPGYIFDSHFVERARFGRLIGFLGNWEIAQDESVIGVGVDDVTAFCIDNDKTGYVFGSGAVNIYKANEGNDFRLSGQKLLANSIEVKQLLHNCTIDLNTFEYTGLNTWVEPDYHTLSHKGNLWLSGSDQLNTNKNMLSHFTASWSLIDTVLIIARANSTLADTYSNHIQNQTGLPAVVMHTTDQNITSPLWQLRIETLEKIIFLDNTYSVLMNFLSSEPNGSLLKVRMLSGAKQIAFVGGDSRFAGKTVLVNYEQEYASYDGLLQFDEGLGLLRNTIIVPKTFASDIDNENAAAGVPYAMVKDSLKYGIWLYGDCFMEYQPHDNSASITSYGDFPMILIENNGALGDLSNQSAVNSGLPRNVAGFGAFTLCLIDSTVVKEVDLVNRLSSISKRSEMYFSPNPARDFIVIKGDTKDLLVTRIYTVTGKLVVVKEHHTGQSIDLQFLKPGMYLFHSENRISGDKTFSKLIVQ
jgi:cyanophycinase